MSGLSKRKYGSGALSSLAEEVLFVMDDCINEREALDTAVGLVTSAEKYMMVLRELIDANPKVVLRMIELALRYDYHLTFTQLNEMYGVCFVLDKKISHGTRIIRYQIQDLAMGAFHNGDSLDCELAKSMPAMFHLLHGDLNQILKVEGRLSVNIKKLVCLDSKSLEGSAIYKEIGIDAMMLLANSTIITHEDASWEGVPKRLCYVKSLAPLEITVMDLIGEPTQLCLTVDGVFSVKGLWSIYGGDLSGTLYTFTGSKIIPCRVDASKVIQLDPRAAPNGTYYELKLQGTSHFSRGLYRVNESISRGTFELTFWL